MPELPSPVTPGEVARAAQYNGLLGCVADLYTQAQRGRFGEAGRRFALEARIRFVRIARVHSDGIVVATVTAPPTDYPDNVTYDVVLWGQGTRLDGIRPVYGRPATGADVKIRPAWVDDWAILLRGKENDEDKGELFILTEELDRVACEAPTAAQQRQALLDLARAVTDIQIDQGLLGTPVLLADIAGELDGRIGPVVATDPAQAQTDTAMPTPNPNRLEARMDLNAGSEDASREVEFALPANVRGVMVAAVPVPEESGTAWSSDLEVFIRVRSSAGTPAIDLPFPTPKTIVADVDGAFTQIPDGELSGVATIVAKRSGTAQAVRLAVVATVTVA